MKNYTELIKALRCEGMSKRCDTCTYGLRLCPDSECNDACHVEKIIDDAAAAIEALQAEAKQAAKRIAELHAELEKWVSAAEKAGEPKRGEWLNVTDSYHWYGKCSVCGEEFVVDAYYAGGMNYCPNCGAWNRRAET